jgi:hypothetical protein
MVEFHPRFERDHDAIMGGDYLDLTLFWREPVSSFLTGAGFREIVDHVGFRTHPPSRALARGRQTP